MGNHQRAHQRTPQRLRWTAAVTALGIALCALVLAPSVAEARACSDYLFSNHTCERAHHGSLFGLTGAALAVVLLLALQAGFTDMSNAAAAALRLRGGPPRPEERPEPPGPKGPPPLIDPWDGEDLIVQDGSYEGGEIGQLWWHGRWVDRDEALELIEAAQKAIARREEQLEAFWAESQELSTQWLKDRAGALRAEAEAEWLERELEETEWERWKAAFANLENIEASADRRDYEDILARLDNAFNEDGTLNVEYVEELSRATRNRIARDLAAPDDTLGSEWVGDWVGSTASEFIRHPVVRIGLGIATKGSSEVFFQSLAAHDALEKAQQEAMDRGSDFTFTDSFRTAGGAFIRENLPVNTWEALRDPEASAWQVAMSLGLDALVTVSSVDTARNLRGSLNRATHGGSWRDIDVFHRADPTDLLRPFRGDPNAPLWRQPSEIEWHVHGASTSHVRQPGAAASRPRVAGQGILDSLPPDIRTEVNRVRDVPTRGPLGQAEDAAFYRGRREGLNKVEDLDAAHRNLDNARAGGNSRAIEAAEARVRDATVEVQKDKNAVHVLNDRARAAQEGAPAGRTAHDPSVEQFNRNIDDMYKRTDEAVIGRLARDPDVPGTEIRAKKVTNVRDPSELTGPAKDKASYDRDVTYEVKRTVRDADGKMVETWQDIPSNKVKQTYDEEFWKASTGRPPPRRPDGSLDHDAMAGHAKEMDQMVTWERHAEAYGAGPEDLRTATQDPFRYRDVSDPHQVGDAITYKVDEWLEGADNAAVRGDLGGKVTNLEEAQRQLIKQTDNMVAKRTEAMVRGGNAPGATVPQGLQQQVDLLRLVDDGILTPSQAEAVLESMGTSTARVASGVGDYVTGLQVLRTPGW